MAYYLGLDTSCYTTSCAIVDDTGAIIAEQRKLLEVPAGKRGLQQSNMVFQHTRALPQLLEQLPQVPLSGIGVSAFPRREEGSYMPAFLVGQGVARALAHVQGVPLYEFSHQENHLLAALRSLGQVPTEPFYGLHVSGGTTELVYSQARPDGFFDTTLVGGTMDLHGGQFVDRVGVAMGLPFPAGPHLEQLANTTKDIETLPVAVKQGKISFGGPCSEAFRRIEKGVQAPAMARGVFSCMSQSLQRMLAYHIDQRPASLLVAVGGVLSNAQLRADLTAWCDKRGVTLQLADRPYSADNATGVAYGASLLRG